METIHVVQGFSAGPRGQVIPDKPLLFRREEEARYRAQLLGESRVGVLAYTQSADPELGEYSEPIIFATVGQVPEV